MAATIEFRKIKLPVGDLGSEATIPAFVGNLTFQNEVEFDLDETAEIFEAYGRASSCYPYREMTTYSRKMSERQIRAIVLEDDVLQAVFLPDFGGRLWSLRDKSSKRDFLYTNNVLRYSNLATRNAWFSGGVEWNIGIIGHTTLSNEPMYVACLESEDYGPILRMYNYERIRGLEYQMDFWLGSSREAAGDEHYLTCRMRVVNSSSKTVPMYWWSNMAVPEYPNGRIIVPASEAYTCGYVGADSKVYKTGFPCIDGLDKSYYHNIENQVDYFFDIAGDCPKFIANVGEDGYGLLHMSTDRLRGRKLFTWGQNKASDHWQEFLSDGSGRYVEIQASVEQTQYGCLPIAAHTAWEWVEQYGEAFIPSGIIKCSYEDVSEYMKEKIILKKQYRNLDEILAKTATMAKTPAKVEPGYYGKPYGALERAVRTIKKEKPLSEHLDYGEMTAEMKEWESFLETGIFISPKSTEHVPEDFYSDDVFYNKLLECIDKGSNKNNWYAHYQLGAMHLYREDYERAASELQISLDCAPNAWAYHALAIVKYKCGKYDSAAEYIHMGAIKRADDLSYIKECFRILLAMKKYAELLQLIDYIPQEMKKEHRIHYDYIIASTHCNADVCPEALKELEDETFTVDDIREGDDDLSNFYRWLYKEVYCEYPDDIPYHLNFHSL